MKYMQVIFNLTFRCELNVTVANKNYHYFEITFYLL